MRLLVNVCVTVFSLLSDGQVAAGYAPYCVFETFKQERSVWHRRRRDSRVEGQIGGLNSNLLWLRDVVAPASQCANSLEDGAARW